MTLKIMNLMVKVVEVANGSKVIYIAFSSLNHLKSLSLNIINFIKKSYNRTEFQTIVEDYKFC